MRRKQRWAREAGVGSGQCQGRGPGELQAYQVPVVGGAGALLGDTHAEAGQAALPVLCTQVEVVGAAAGAGGSLRVGLREAAEMAVAAEGSPRRPRASCAGPNVPAWPGAPGWGVIAKPPWQQPWG